MQFQLGRLLDFLHDLSLFVTRGYAVVLNLVQQLGSLYSDHQKLFQVSFRHVHLETAFAALADMLGVFVTLDSIIQQNTNLQHAWTMYKRMVRTVRAEPERFGVQEAQVRLFERMAQSLEGQLFAGTLFQNSITQTFDIPGICEVQTNRVFIEEFGIHVKQLFAEAMSVIGMQMLICLFQSLL